MHRHMDGQITWNYEGPFEYSLRTIKAALIKLFSLVFDSQLWPHIQAHSMRGNNKFEKRERH